MTKSRTALLEIQPPVPQYWSPELRDISILQGKERLTGTRSASVLMAIVVAGYRALPQTLET